ncbi:MULTISPECIES: DUF2378 family protein [Myxococcaceae]|uniref:DUF2378 family protein n=1 Tax=Myxococcaceae TaxID=31 RepID=UPI00188E66FF|nr:MULTISPECIES: DUF2378 family protein [Myxococcaceae]MBF5043401.1 DUF2378 family protein [Simulacricoccus sp. 17bor-14]
MQSQASTAVAPSRHIFGHAMEGLLRVLGPEPTDEDLRVLHRLGMSLDALEVTYPLEAHLALLDHLVQSRWAQLPGDEGYAALGRATVEAYEGTLMGRVLLQMLRVLGPERVLYRLTKTFRSTNNYTETQVREVGPRHFEVWINVALRPGFVRGLLEQGLCFAGAHGVRVGQMVGRDGCAVYYVRWDAPEPLPA